MSRSRGERKRESVKEMDERAKQKGRGAKEEESEVWAVDVKVLFFSPKMKC